MFVNGVPLSWLQQKSFSEETKDSSRPRQTLELRGCMVKNVIFEGGNGEVILSDGSTLTGNITGGKNKI